MNFFQIIFRYQTTFPWSSLEKKTRTGNSATRCSTEWTDICWRCRERDCQRGEEENIVKNFLKYIFSFLKWNSECYYHERKSFIFLKFSTDLHRFITHFHAGITRNVFGKARTPDNAHNEKNHNSSDWTNLSSFQTWCLSKMYEIESDSNFMHSVHSIQEILPSSFQFRANRQLNQNFVISATFSPFQTGQSDK